MRLNATGILLTAFFYQKAFSQHSLSSMFKNPPVSYRPVPFWHLNGHLTKDEIEKQVRDAVKSGFGGVTVLPVTPGPQYPTNLPAPGMTPTYLSNEYFERYRDILNAAKHNGGQVILYDDIDFPSGTVGGAMKKRYPEMVRKNLVKTDTVIEGPAMLNIPLPAGKLMAVVGIESNSSNRVDLTQMVKQRRIAYNLPSGKWNLMFFTEQADADGIVDYMDPAAVKQFITLTYDGYAKRFGSYFGSTIKQTFFDDVGYVTKERGWTDAVNSKFRAMTGKDAQTYYPALWNNIGPETEAARVAFFDARAELLSEGFPKLVAEWDAAHHLKASGHPPGSYEIQPTDMNFDVFKFYRHEQIPTMDAIFYHGHGRDGFKLISSAAAFYDRPVVASETYGAFFEKSFDVNMLYRTAMELFIRGVNFLVPHGMWYNPDAKAVRIPPLISPYSEKLAPALPAYNNFAARACLMLQGGRQVANIGILYPIAAMQAFYSFDANDNKEVGHYAPQGTDYLKLSDLLTDHIHRDFSFTHPQLFAGTRYQLKGQEVVLANAENQQSYKVIIVPAGRVISYAALQKLKAFFDDGGKIIATGRLPEKSAEFGKDVEVSELVKQLFGSGKPGADSVAINSNVKGGRAVFIPSLTEARLTEWLNRFDPAPDVTFENNPEPSSANGALSYLHKINKGLNIYYIANSTDDAVDSFVYLKGAMQVQLWDPLTGTSGIKPAQSIIKVKGQPYTRVKLTLGAVKSVFFISDAKRIAKS